MSFGFGFALPHWQTPGAAPAPPPPSGAFDVLPSSGSPTYAVTSNVLDSSNAAFAVSATVLSSNGTSYSPI